MNGGMRRSLASLFGTLFVIGSLVMPSAAQAAYSPGVLPPQSSIFGQSAGAVSAAWWQWAFEIPVHAPPCPQPGTTYNDCANPINHPLVDLTGARCGVGQSGSVWFLGGAFTITGQPFSSTVDRDCTVAAGEALFFPVVDVECSFLEGATYGCPGGTIGDLRADIAPVIDAFEAPPSSLEADIDGARIPISASDRVQSPAFCFHLPSDNLLSAIGEGPFRAGTRCSAVADGYYLVLAPLSPGEHTLHFHAAARSLSFDLDVTYHLAVAA